MDEIRLLEVTYENFAEHEPLRRAIIEVRRREGAKARNTVLCVMVQRPCVQLGEFQDIDEEVEVQECRRLDVSIARRAGGGGCLFYDDQTRFVVALLDAKTFESSKSRVPDLEEAARVWQGEVITGTLRDLGAKDAWYRHIGDVQVDQSKISGLGTALIQNTLYLGSFMNIGTPRVELAQRVLRIPPEKFADKPVSQLDEYVTSVEKITGRLPAWEEFREALRRNLMRVFKVGVNPGEVSPEERRTFEELRPVYASEEWIFKRSSARRFAELPAEVAMGKSRRKARKLVVAQVAVDDRKRIYRAMLSGDFFIQPGNALEEMEKNLQGVEARDEERTLRTIGDTLSDLKAQTPMLTPEDFALPVIQAGRDALKKKE
jgi:lipoate-protein ligase A